jgi:hypothetical protein
MRLELEYGYKATSAGCSLRVTGDQGPRRRTLLHEKDWDPRGQLRGTPRPPEGCWPNVRLIFWIPTRDSDERYVSIEGLQRS